MALKDRLVEWNDSYKLGIDAVDEQHEVLFDIMNHLWSAIIHRASSAEMTQILADLEHYTVLHFTEEEAFMRSHNYANYAAHKLLHDEFVQRVRDLGNAARSGKQVDLELLSFLRQWLVNHILVKDREYVDDYEKSAKPTSLLSRFFGKLVFQ